MTGRSLRAVLLAATVLLMACATAVSPAAAATTLQEDQSLAVDVDLESGSGSSQTVEADAGTLNFTAFETDIPEGHSYADFEWEWSTGPDASGEFTSFLSDNGANEFDATATYELADADAGETFDVTLEVSHPTEGIAGQDTFTVTVEGEGDGEAPSVDVDYVHDPDASSVVVAPDAGTLTFVGSEVSHPDYANDELDYEWAVEGPAAGELTTIADHPGYDDDLVAEYELADADAGQTFDVVLTVETPDGASGSARVTVEVGSGGEQATADVEWVQDPAADVVEAQVTDDELVFVAVDVEDAATDGDDRSNVDYEWSTEGDNEGTVVPGSEYTEAYETDVFAVYDLAAADAGTTFDVVLEVSNGVGEATESRLTVSVAGDEGSSDGQDADDDSGGTLGAPGGGSTGDGADTDGQSADGTEGESGAQTASFTISTASAGMPMVFEARNARADARASTDVGVDAGVLDLDELAVTAAQDADAFEVTLDAAEEVPDHVEDRVLATLALEDGEMLDHATVTFAVDESELPDGVAAEDLRVYGVQDGSLTETGADPEAASTSADLAKYDALAVLGPSEPDSDVEGDEGGLGTLGTVAILVLLGAGAGAVVYLRQ